VCICIIVSNGFGFRAFSLFFAAVAASADSARWDSEVFSSVARAEGSRRVVEMASSRSLSGLSFSFDGDALAGSLLADGGTDIFFCSSGFGGPFTSFSMAPASDASSCGFEGIDEPDGGGSGSAAVP